MCGESLCTAFAAIGITESTLRAWESGATSPRVDWLRAIAEQWGVSAAWLLMGAAS